MSELGRYRRKRGRMLERGERDYLVSLVPPTTLLLSPLSIGHHGSSQHQWDRRQKFDRDGISHLTLDYRKLRLIIRETIIRNDKDNR
jgi:hypothetical protein